MLNDWEEPMLEEYETLERLGLVECAGLLKDLAPASSYQARNLTRNPQRAAKQDQERRRRRGTAALRQANQWSMPLSVLARSLSMFMRSVPQKEWNDLAAQREVVTKPTCIRILERARLLDPGPGYPTHPKVFGAVADNCYTKGWNGKGGTSRAAERVDAEGAFVTHVLTHSHSPCLLRARGLAQAVAGSSAPVGIQSRRGSTTTTAFSACSSSQASSTISRTTFRT